MPEGHTLFRLARDLDDAFGRRPVRVASPQGRFAADAATLDGLEVTHAESAGKHLFVGFPDDRFIHIHLGLIGKFDITPLSNGEVPLPVGQVRLRLFNEDYVADLRGATQCDLIGEAKREAIVAKLGPDPLRADADPSKAWDRIHKTHQAVLAGIGNVYRAEVLFRHKIHPLRPGNTLRKSQWDSIWADLVELLAEGVRTGRIDTVHSEHTPEAMGRPPRVDDHGGEVYVYRRKGMPCYVCGSIVKTEELAGRNSFWCPKCQRPYRAR